ncbi:protein-arginine deiminase family protein [Corallococcus sp. AS-1-6]|uniref:protein-arginine deiminase family protein n=1 Tax=Corallococcus sp. AS-1-6 TaxID=2874599 RepID=UPI001CBE1924|nr:protein-arginine deiminase family protein [Corallococcus sp. AS-1-6]MBZ4376068.1 hypothetical protein [Corallococcus sp. AS-1-6]
MSRRVTVQLIDEQYEPVANEAVRFVETGLTLRTNDQGEAVFEYATPTATLEYRLRSGAVATHRLKEPLSRETTVVLGVEALVYATLFLDADRDGTLTSAGLDRWDWGPGEGKKGAIVLCNLDADNGNPRVADNADDVINGGDDEQEIAPLEVRRQTRYRAEVTCTLSLQKPGDKNRLRIFNGRTRGARALIGPSAGASCVLDLQNAVLRLGMEAVRFDESLKEEDIVLLLTTTSPEGTVVQRARVRVAPWMMQHHLEAPEAVYVIQLSGQNNTTFRSDLKVILEGVGLPLEEIPTVLGDRWGQDSLEIGSSNLPRRGMHAMLGATRRSGMIQYFKTQGRGVGMGYFDFHHRQISHSASDSDMNKLGNLEVTPPVRDARGRAYPWGRIYYGTDVRNERRQLDPNIRAFLAAQRVQAPIVIDTSWLDVGHADELLSFVPAEDGGWLLCLPSPELALDMLQGVMEVAPQSVMLEGRSIQGVEGEGFDEPVNTTVKAFFEGAEGGGAPARRPHGMSSLFSGPPPRMTGVSSMRPMGGMPFPGRTGAPPGFMMGEGAMHGFSGGISEAPTLKATLRFNETAAKGIHGLVEQLKSEIGLTEERILYLPMLYRQGRMKGATTVFANMVNMLVLGRTCVMAKPFGPMLDGAQRLQGPYAKLLGKYKIEATDVPMNGTFDLFEVYVRTLFRRNGLTARFIDDWSAYHNKGGEVHCATNTRRALTLKRWWEYVPGDTH